MYKVVQFGSIREGKKFRYKKCWFIKSRHNLAYLSNWLIAHSGVHIMKDEDYIGIEE